MPSGTALFVKITLGPRTEGEISPWRPPLPPAAGRNTPLHATRLRLPLAAAEKLLCPTVIDRAHGEIISDKLFVYRFDFLLRRGARGLRGLPYAGGGLNKAEKTPAKHPTDAPAGGASRHSGLTYRARKTVFVRAPGEIIPDKLIVYRFDFPP